MIVDMLSKQDKTKVKHNLKEEQLKIRVENRCVLFTLFLSTMLILIIYGVFQPIILWVGEKQMNEH